VPWKQWARGLREKTHRPPAADEVRSHGPQGMRRRGLHQAEGHELLDEPDSAGGR